MTCRCYTTKENTASCANNGNGANKLFYSRAQSRRRIEQACARGHEPAKSMVIIVEAINADPVRVRTLMNRSVIGAAPVAVSMCMYINMFFFCE
jgi:hypothetical protein